MFARAFVEYVKSELNERAWQNDYLVKVSIQKAFDAKFRHSKFGHIGERGLR